MVTLIMKKEEGAGGTGGEARKTTVRRKGEDWSHGAMDSGKLSMLAACDCMIVCLSVPPAVYFVSPG